MARPSRLAVRLAGDRETIAPVARRAGRRPSGPNGARVSDYPQVMIRLPPATKAALDALSGVTGTPVWQIVDRAVTGYMARLPAGEQKLVAHVQRRRTRGSQES